MSPETGCGIEASALGGATGLFCFVGHEEKRLHDGPRKEATCSCEAVPYAVAMIERRGDGGLG